MRAFVTHTSKYNVVYAFPLTFITTPRLRNRIDILLLLSNIVLLLLLLLLLSLFIIPVIVCNVVRIRAFQPFTRAHNIHLYPHRTTYYYINIYLLVYIIFPPLVFQTTFFSINGGSPALDEWFFFLFSFFVSIKQIL